MIPVKVQEEFFMHAKKIISLLLSAVMVLGLCACSTNGQFENDAEKIEK